MPATDVLKCRGPGLLFFLSSVLLVFCTGCSAGGPGDTASFAAEFDAELRAVVASGKAPSVQVAVVREGQIVLSRAYGESSSVDHVYMNASVQKSFTATAVLQLVERGLVDLDADVSEYLPFAVRRARPICWSCRTRGSWPRR